jgi:hypothetical protein
MFFALAGVGLASHWGGYTAGNDKEVDFCLVDLTSDMHDAYHWNEDNNVVWSDVFPTSSHTPCLGEVDVFDGDYGDTNWSGFYDCLDFDDPVCSWGRIRLNLFYSHDLSARRWVVCQEVGHSLGLNHSSDSNSCMKNTYDSSPWLTSHDLAEINSQ